MAPSCVVTVPVMTDGLTVSPGMRSVVHSSTDDVASPSTQLSESVKSNLVRILIASGISRVTTPVTPGSASVIAILGDRTRTPSIVPRSPSPVIDHVAPRPRASRRDALS